MVPKRDLFLDQRYLQLYVFAVGFAVTIKQRSLVTILYLADYSEGDITILGPLQVTLKHFLHSIYFVHLTNNSFRCIFILIFLSADNYPFSLKNLTCPVSYFLCFLLFAQVSTIRSSSV